jgi:DNA-binding CsgD family transcriptional regulator
MSETADRALASRANATDGLPANKREVLEMLVQGRSVTETAQSTGVGRRTVYNWLKDDPAFAALYNQWHEEMKETCRSRLLMLGGKAAGAIEKALEAGDAKTALQLLKGIGLLTPTPEKPTDAEEVRKDAELERKNRQTERQIAEAKLRTQLASDRAAEKMWRK